MRVDWLPVVIPAGIAGLSPTLHARLGEAVGWRASFERVRVASPIVLVLWSPPPRVLPPKGSRVKGVRPRPFVKRVPHKTLANGQARQPTNLSDFVVNDHIINSTPKGI